METQRNKEHSMSDREIRNGLLSEKAAEEGIVLLKMIKKHSL